MAKVRTLVENKYVVLYNRLRAEKAATVKKARARYDERIKKCATRWWHTAASALDV